MNQTEFTTDDLRRNLALLEKKKETDQATPLTVGYVAQLHRELIKRREADETAR